MTGTERDGWGPHWSENEKQDPTPDDERSPARKSWIFAFVLALVALAVTAALVTRGGGSDTVAVNPDDVGPLVTAPDEAQVDGEAAATVPEGPSAPTEPADPVVDEVPESHAIVKGGQIYLEGAVPDRASADAIVALAGEVLGPDNVFDNYLIDPRAGDPSQGSVRVEDHVLFHSNSAVIAPEFEPLLLQAVGLMTIRPLVTMTIVGHTDSVGSNSANLDLSQQRAQSVVDFMAGLGIDPARLTAVGRGEADPIGDNDTPEGRLLNRRIEVEIENLLSQ